MTFPFPFFRPNSQSNRATTGGAIASSFNAGSTASNAFDGNSGTYWLTNGAISVGNDWIGNDLGAAYAIVTVTVQQLATNSINKIDIQYSDDNSTWSSALTAQTAHTDGSVDTYSVSSGSHRYWRIRDNSGATGPAVSGGLRWGVTEVTFVG